MRVRAPQPQLKYNNMTREEIYNAPKCAGIYCIKNTINGKCYIGQAIKLQKRLKAHWKNFSSDSYSHIVIYKAFKKYGIENFELIILKTISDSLSQRTKKELDELEKFYIEKYDSYNNGYNSTLGGDGGVLGYKHTEETKEKLREYAIAQAKEKEKDESNWYKAKNIFTGEEIIGCSQKDLSEKSKIPYYTIRNKNGEFDQKVTVVPCHGWIHFNIIGDKLNMTMFQRSCDTVVGLPSNWAQYTALLLAMSNVMGLKPGEFVHMISNAHIYSNTFDTAKTLLSRESAPFPTLKVVNNHDSLFDYRKDDFALEDYHPKEKILKIPLGV